MGKILALSSVVLVLVCAAAVQTAPAGDKPAVKAGPCRTTISGHRWLIAPLRISCSDAKSVVATLANRRVPAGAFYRGTYQGMRCLSTSPRGTKPKQLTCGTSNHSKSMIAFRQ